MLDFWHSLAGMVEVELTAAELGNSFGAISRENIPVFSVSQVDELTARFQIYRRDLPGLLALTEKREETLRLCSHRGLYWQGLALLKRPVLLMGLMLSFLAALYLPTRVFFVRVEGNASLPTRSILSAAESSGIRFGASRREVRSERVKNSMLEKLPQLQWAGVNTYGCVAVISVGERPDEEEEAQAPAVSSIVAARDGVILSCTATRGNALCTPGQVVRKGEILISGYTDCGIAIQATRAEGEVFAQTGRNLSAVTPIKHHVIRCKTLCGRKFSLLIGKKRINLWNYSGISEGTCGRMYEEYYITLPGDFALPLALCVEEFYSYETNEEILPPDAAMEKLAVFAERYLTEQMIAGRILSKEEDLTEEEGLYRLNAFFICAEMIGREQREQIGDIHGKNS